MRTKPNPVEITREVTVIETPPTQTTYQCKFLLASEDERRRWKQENPHLNVRLATFEERAKLRADIRDEDM